MGIINYVLRRVILVVVVVLGVITITFVLARYVPGDPVLAYLGDRAREDQVLALHKKWGLDKPFFEQYVIFIRNLMTGDLGTSIRTQHPVATDLSEYLPFTLELATAALIISLVVGVPLGIAAALHKDSPIDHVSRLTALSGASMPIFWLGLLALGLFYFRLGLMPGPGLLAKGLSPPPHITGSYVLDSLLSLDLPAFYSSMAHLILPASVVSAYATAMTTRIVRSSMIEVMGEDFIRTARAKGLPRAVVTYRHALRNAFIPAVTVIGLNYGALLSGAIITETVFNRPGLGTYAMASVLSVDYPAILGVTFVISLVYVTVNLAVDILYAFIDPRIRFT
jgi:peptide/nickel transport system permease protein